MSRLKGVLFDYGHTLVWFPHYGRIHFASARNVQKKLQELGVFVGIAEIRASIDRFAHRRNGTVLKIDEEFREILSVLGVKACSQDDLREMIRMHWQPYVQDARSRRDVENVLRYLKTQGLRLGIVANIWSGGMDPALEKPDLQRYFDTAVASVDVGFQKPDPQIFQLALDRLKLASDETIMVGDNPTSDIQGAHNLGLSTVRLLRGPNRKTPDVVEPDFRIRNFQTLKTIVRKFSRSRAQQSRL